MKSAFRYSFLSLLLVGATVATPVFAQEEAVVAPTQTEGNRMERLRSLVDQREQAESERVEARKLGRSIAGEPSESTGLSAIRILEGLALTLGIFFLGVWGYQKITGRVPHVPGGKVRRIKVLERATVGNKTSLVIAEIDGRTVLFSVGAEQVSFFSDSAWLEGAWDKEKASEGLEAPAHQQP